MSQAGIPHLLHVFSTFVPAGPEMRSVRMINAFGHEFRHSILAIDGRTQAAEQLAADARASILPSIERANTPRTVLALRRLFREQSPDLVLSYNWGAFDSVFATRSLGWRGRHIHHEDGFNADEAHSFKGRRVWTRRLLLPGVARVVVPSQVLCNVAREHWKLREAQVRLIPNGIDLDSFAGSGGSDELRRSLSIPSDAAVVGFVGHLRPVKNPVRLVQAFAQVQATPAPHLVVLGEGEEHAAMASAAQAAGISERVHLVGHKAQTAPWYAMMDLFAISSNSEQMPVALLEAMASSLPVATTNVGDVAHMLPDVQQALVVKHTSDALAQAIADLVNAPDLRKRLGQANRTRVCERYSFDVMLSAYRELFQSTLSSCAR